MNRIDLDRVKVVSWDIDGTLYCLSTLIRRFKRDLVLRVLTLRWFSVLRDFSRILGFKRFMDRIRAEQGDYRVPPVPGRARIAQTQEEMYGRILPEIGMLDGVEALLDWFQQAGFPQVVLSDYRATGKLKALGLSDRFSQVFAGEDLGHLKPAPQVFQKMCEALGIRPDQLLHIGDRADTDGAAADALGYQVILIGPEFESAAGVLAHLSHEE